ncbi:acyl carrier protein [Streptomyces sp. NPDC006602]|uniref:acyl carrier protein n=1 Tax=Streptomyces sp. NPDC006602 TaxID=3364751 RepID=UPI003697EC40
MPLGRIEPTAARADIERAVTEIWSDQLGLTDIGPQEDFFDLGGHSLHAVEITSRIEQTFGVDISLRAFYEAPTVSGVAEGIASVAGNRG